MNDLVLSAMLSGNYSVVDTNNVTDISKDLLDNNGRMILHKSEFYKKYTKDSLRHFCHQHARYGIPTVELVNCVKNIIGDRDAIEIGAGAGDFGYHLGIPMTDSKLQNDPKIRAKYDGAGQPTINYPSDVIRLEAIEAVYRYKPKVVVGSWITPYSPKQTNFRGSPFGVKMEKILSLVDTLVLIGNLDIHGCMPIRRFDHEVCKGDWLVSRASCQSNNCIMVWG